MDIHAVFTGCGRDVEMSTESARESCRQMVPRHYEPCCTVGLSSEMFGLSAETKNEQYSLDK